MPDEWRYRGQTISSEQIAFLRRFIAAHPDSSRWKLSRQLCEALGWKQPNGALRDVVCRGLLLMLERAGQIELPPVRRHIRGQRRNARPRPDPVLLDTTPLARPLGEVVPVEQFIERARAYLAATEADPGRMRDNSRVVIVGSFCEQPPLGLIKTVERAGCYIVDDDFLVGNRFLTRDVPLEGDPVRNLARTFVRHTVKNSVLYEEDPAGKRALVRERVEAARADGVIFAAASFCDPALLDQPMLRAGAEAAGIPCIAFRFAENTGQFQQFREQAGTFSDSIKLWGAA